MDPENGRMLKRPKTMSLSLQEFKTKLLDSINSQLKTINIPTAHKRLSKRDEADNLLEGLDSDNGKNNQRFIFHFVLKLILELQKR